MKLFKSKFSKDIGILTAGKIAAQVIPIACTPLLTRLYAPETFTAFALFVTTINILSMVAAFSYDTAIVLPKEEKEASLLFVLSCLSVFAVTIFLFVATELWGHLFLVLLKDETLQEYLYLLPIGVLLLALFQAQNYFYNRHKKYTQLAISQIIVELVNIFSVLVLGSLGWLVKGLIVGQLIARFAGCIYLARWIYRSIRDFSLDIRYATLKAVAKTYSDFPKYQTPRMLSSHIQANITIYLYTAFFPLDIVGLIYMSRKLVQRPLTAFSESVSQVFYKELASTTDFAQMQKDYKNLVVKVTLLSLPIVLIPWLVPERWIAVLLGEKWSGAIDYIRLFAFGNSGYFVNNCVQHVYTTLGKQRLKLIFSLVKGAIFALLIYAGHVLFDDAYPTVIMIVVYTFIHNWMAVIYGYKLLGAAKAPA
jgi:O-antigen/teichoic acid export membrane protein